MQMTKTGHVSVSLNSIPLSFGKAVQTFFIPILRGISTAAEHPPSMWEAALVLVGAIAVACFVLAPTAAWWLGLGAWFCGSSVWSVRCSEADSRGYCCGG